MKLTCSKCYGNKTYRGMGSMIVKCEPCKGSGVLDVEVTLAPLSEKKASKKPRKGIVDEKRSEPTETE